LLPLVPGPLWMKNRSQPIAIRNVSDYLLAALTNPNGRGAVFEIGGPDILAYTDLMLGYARHRGLKRSIFLLPGIPLWFMAFGVALMTPVPYPIAYALIDGLSADSVVKYPQALSVFPEVKLIDFDAATRDALAETHPARIERVWEDGRQEPRSIKHEGCFIDHRESRLAAAPEEVFQKIMRFVEKRGWKAEVNEMHRRMVVSVPKQAGGRKWIEWRIRDDGITQTVFFRPRGLPGFLYWYLLYPFHVLNFRGWIESIAKACREETRY
ncbi:MAG TPA: DUF2867 domain-containing protein, partial [Anaerolineales bacterium]|nr:DUF2867 domain-containing protein [Anaerolineales bacterium]